MKKTIVLFFCAMLSFYSLWAQTPAFPSAEGGGMFTSGGRGGKVYYVNTLTDNDEGDATTNEGSLRWCINRQGERTILFKVNGTIQLQDDLRIKNGNLTIAGQSASGDGICLAGYPVHISGSNVIVRYMRFRMGDVNMKRDVNQGADAFGGGKAEKMIIDHCSISWGTDECSSFYDNKDFTMQWCIISESLRLAGHIKGPHGYGAIWGGVNASFHHNLLAHHDSRTPRLGPGTKHAGQDTTDVRNNVFYNWNGNGCYGGEAMHVNLINNYYKAGPATHNKIATQITAISVNKGTSGFERIKNIWGKYYIAGNVMPHNKSITNNNWLGVKMDTIMQCVKLNNPLKTSKVHTQSALMAYNKVLKYAGCCKNRDSVDKRIVDETASGTARFEGLNEYNRQGGKWKSEDYPRKGIIDSQADTKPMNAESNWSAWPELKDGKPIVDTNRDGIPDGWLETHYPNKKANDATKDGYTYLEVYLNSLVKDITIGLK